MTAKTIRYSMHPSYRMEPAFHRNLEERTGKDLASWVRLLRKSGPGDEPSRRKWLREEHGLSINYAWWVAGAAGGKAMGSAGYDPERNVEEMYAGPKAALLPLHGRLCRLALSLGEDVKVCPCETIVPFYRKYVFAQLEPASADRLYLGLALGDAKAAGRLEALARSMGNRITHRVALRAADEPDGAVEKWLREAYALGNETRKRSREPGAVPDDLARLLKRSAKAGATFEALTPRMKAEWIDWITEAKKAETRAGRLKRAEERLGRGLKSIY